MAGYIGSKASVVSSGAERKKVFNITTSTTALTGLSYTANQVHVFHNGVRLISGTDYTETNDTTITLTNAAENGDQVVVVSYASFQTSDTVSASAGGTFSNDVAVNGDLTVDTDTLYVDSTSNRVGIGTSSPSQPLEVNGLVRLGDEAGSILDISGSATSANGILLNSTYYGSGGFGPIKFNTSNTERMRIDVSGRVTMPYQPSFSAYRSSGQSISGSTVLIFDTTLHNIGGHYSTSTGAFTAPVAGTYFFSFKSLLYSMSSSELFDLYPQVNNADRKRYEQSGNSGLHTQADYSEAIYLNANDTFRLVGNDRSTGSYGLYANENHFSGYLIG